MKRVMIFCLLILLVACAAPTVEVSVEEVSRAVIPAGAELMIVRPEGAAGETQVFDMNKETLLYSLPAGRTDIAQTTHFHAELTEAGTQLIGTELSTARQTYDLTVAGEWQLAGLSPNGEWLVLSQADETTTTVQIVDISGEREHYTTTEDGTFEVEAISNDGQYLYLIEHLSEGNYRVRLYDVFGKELAAEPLRDKRINDTFMTGYAWGTTTTQDGQWLLTLYLDQTRKRAFVHALNLDTNLTLCLALSSGDGDFATLQQYSLTVSTDGAKVYAANAALGRVVILDLVNFDKRTVVGFDPAGVTPSRQTMQTSLLTPDGHTLYFALDNQLWAYDTEGGVVSEAIQGRDIISGLAYNQEEATLHLAHTNDTLKVLSVDRFAFPLPLAGQ